MIASHGTRAALSPMARPMVQRLVAQLRDGHLHVGQRLPTVRALAQQHRVSYSIAHQAIAYLESIGLVETLQGSGTYVAQRPPERPAAAPASDQVFVVSSEIPQTYAVCVHPIVQQLQASGLLVVPLDYGINGSRLPELQRIFERWRTQPPRAVILKGSIPPMLDAIADAVPPGTCVVMSYASPAYARHGWHLVTPEYETGFYMAARWLIEHGHERIGMVVPPPTTRYKGRTRTRDTSVAGALRAFSEHKLKRGLKVHVNPKRDDDPRSLGLDAANIRKIVRWITSPGAPTGFIATGHRAGCIKLAAQQAGLTIGKDIELVTYGIAAPALRGEHPCVVEAHDVIAQQIARIVLEHGTDAPGVVKRIVVPPRLVERQTGSGALPQDLEVVTSLANWPAVPAEPEPV